MDLNEEPIQMIECPKVIFVKEYFNGSNQQTTRSKISRGELVDERVSLSPFYLEDNLSVKSFQSAPSRLEDQPIDDPVIDAT